MNSKNFDLRMGDCLELMRELPDASVDLVLCDLPYGTTQNKWDSVIPFGELWAEYKRVCRGMVVLTASQPFTSQVVMSAPDLFKYLGLGEVGGHRPPEREAHAHEAARGRAGVLLR